MSDRAFCNEGHKRAWYGKWTDSETARRQFAEHRKKYHSDNRRPKIVSINKSFMECFGPNRGAITHGE